MDTRTGEIFTGSELAKAFGDPERKPFMKKFGIPPTARQVGRRPPRVGRNEPCPCGSGRKFKHCCLTVASQS